MLIGKRFEKGKRLLLMSFYSMRRRLVGYRTTQSCAWRLWNVVSSLAFQESSSVFINCRFCSDNRSFLTPQLYESPMPAMLS